MREMSDQQVRATALDPEQSFIVQAPAGSGKTELLIQRHLLLLGRVRYPEQVVAVTFTRKAAAEMRSRVLELLELAAGATDDVPAHRERSLDLARRALARDREYGWQILDRPGRLRIDTVDALNGWLAERLPIASGGMSGAAVLNSPQAAYRKAATRMLEAAMIDDELRSDTRVLLAAADNSFEGLVRAIVAVIPARDQWLPLLSSADRGELQGILQDGIAQLVERRIRIVFELLDRAQVRELEYLVNHVRQFTDVPSSDAAPNAEGAAGSLTEAAGDETSSLSFWRIAAFTVLTGSGGWRKRLTRREGFGPSHKIEKERCLRLIAALEALPRVRQSLVDIAALPSLVPSATQVDRVASALKLLLHTVAELKVVFQQEHSVDFLELAMGAQAALGSLEAPSELLLAMDMRIEHLLVDEFQDTSHSQFHLLELLTAGWSENDGRTLFLVGDPMQSIYRFRDADMSLFLRAKFEGIGIVRLEHLVLRNNFRSAPKIVRWVNSTFKLMFPATDDPAAGMAAYRPFTATQDDRPGDSVTIHRVSEPGFGAQHRVVTELAITHTTAAQAGTIAVLVQSRGHLKGLRRMLEAAGVRVRAVELDTLCEQPAVQDLLGLTRAMLHLSDRIAWLAVLRAAWCGLSWSDVHSICANEPERPIIELLSDTNILSGLSSDEARVRAEFVRDRLRAGMMLRGKFSFVQWIECCWQLLDGPATLTSQDELDQVHEFFAILGEQSADADVPDTAELGQALEVPFLGGRTNAWCNEAPALDIMTIHRAKGLEFDTVILFGLERRVRSAENKLIYWQSHRTPSGTPTLIASAMNTAGDPLTDYLRAVHRDMDLAERGRLLYVAVTRARRRLHLIGYLPELESGESPAAGTLMWWVANQFQQANCKAPAQTGPGSDLIAGDEWFVSPLIALDPDPEAPVGPRASDVRSEEPERREFDWVRIVAAHVGTVVHKALQRVGDGSNGRGAEFLDAAALGRYRRELKLMGVPGHAVEAAAERVREILESATSDKIGRWILETHELARSEYELAVVEGGYLRHFRIDRTFIDTDGWRWIIDYKSSQHTGGNLEEFLDSEVVRYRGQLETYARAMYDLDPRPTRVGLYFPVLNAFRDWVPEIIDRD